jgi:hypothetical protein
MIKRADNPDRRFTSSGTKRDMALFDTAARPSGTSGSTGVKVMMLTLTGLTCMMLFGCYSGSPTKLELEIPTLSFPYNGMMRVPDTLTLNWNSSGWATSFSVQVSIDRNFSSLVVSAITTSLSQPIDSPLVNNTTYFWRVSASDGQLTSEWSAVFSFTTGVAAPVLSDPEDNSIWVPETLTLGWSTSIGDSMYYVQVSTDSVFSTFAVNDSTDTASFPIDSPLTQSTTYYWRVSVLKLQGLSGWSATGTFNTVDSLPAPALSYPADSTVNVSLVTDSLKWSSIPSYWASYRLQVSTTADFSGNVVMDTTLPSSSLTAPIDVLLPATIYFWRVAARLFLTGFMDRQGDWSAVRSFTTQ